MRISKPLVHWLFTVQDMRGWPRCPGCGRSILPLSQVPAWEHLGRGCHVHRCCGVYAVYDGRRGVYRFSFKEPA